MGGALGRGRGAAPGAGIRRGDSGGVRDVDGAVSRGRVRSWVEAASSFESTSIDGPPTVTDRCSAAEADGASTREVPVWAEMETGARVGVDGWDR